MKPFIEPARVDVIPAPKRWPSDAGLIELCYEFMESGINWGITIDEYIEKLEMLVKTAELDKISLSIPKINQTYNSIDIVHPDITEKDDARIVKLVLKFKLANDWIVLLREKAKSDSLIASYLVHLEKNLEREQGYHQDAYEVYQTLLPKDVEENLKLREIALIHVYLGKSITKKNCNEIAESYGLTSGHKLIQHFNKLRNRSYRINAGTERETTSKIALIRKVIELLPEDKRLEAEEELNILVNRQL